MELERCFAIFGLGATFSATELKQTYRDLVEVWHPDRFTHNPRLQRKAAERLKEVNAAYEVLKSARKGAVCETTASAGKGPDKRRYHRIPCRLSLNHAIPGRSVSPFTDCIEDISAGGVFIRTAEPYRPCQRLSLSFTLPRFGELIDLPAEVVWQGRGGVGVCFRISPRYRRFLATFL